LHAGAAGSSRGRASEAVGPLEATSAGGMQLRLRPMDAGVAIVGVRLHVGSTGAASAPAEVRLAGRSLRLRGADAAGTGRWHALQLTAAEALAEPEPLLQVVATVTGVTEDRERRPLDIWLTAGHDRSDE
jgi:hypothetical protein